MVIAPHESLGGEPLQRHIDSVMLVDDDEVEVVSTSPIAWHGLDLMCGRGVGMVASRLASFHTPHDGATHHMVRIVAIMVPHMMINSQTSAPHRFGMCRAISDIYKALP